MALIKKNNIIESKVLKVETKFDHEALLNKAQNIEVEESKANILPVVDSTQPEENASSSSVNISVNEPISPIPRVAVTDSKEIKELEAKVENLRNEYDKLQQEMSALRSSTQQEVEAMKSGAQMDAEKMKQEAKENGYQEGLTSAKSEYSSKSSELVAVIGSLVKEKKKIFTGAEKEILNLSVKIAEQLIKSEISYNQGVILNIVTEAISKITDRDKIIVRVSRQDYEYVQNNRNRIMNLMDDIKNLVVQEDSGIDAGGCIVETELGYIDSRISLKLDAIKAALNKSYDDLHFDEVLSGSDLQTHDQNDVAVNEETVINNVVNEEQIGVEQHDVNAEQENHSDVYDSVPEEIPAPSEPEETKADDLFSDDAFDDDDDDFFDFDDDDDDDFWS